MSRVIKFRVFDGRGMYFGGFSIHATGKFIDESWYHEEGQEYPVMQFTGLHDKNNQEIFESDILQDHNGVGVVEWHKSAFRVNYRNGYAKWFYDYTLKGEFESIEVIGNLHQNPELIK